MNDVDPEEESLRAWFRRYGPPALDPSYDVDAESWAAMRPPPPRPLLRNVGLLVAGLAALFLMARVLPALGRAALGASVGPRPPAIAFEGVRYSSSPYGSGGVTGGTVTRVPGPRAFRATRTFAPFTTDIFETQYYVVAGVKAQGVWSYPMGITAAGMPSAWKILSFPLAINDHNHTELVEVGVVPQSFFP